MRGEQAQRGQVVLNGILASYVTESGAIRTDVISILPVEVLKKVLAIALFFTAKGAITEPAAPTAINTDRMAIRPSSLQVEYIPDVKWTDRAPALVQTLMVESFENSGKIVGVGRRAIGLTGDYVLSSELREFEAVADGAGGATVVVRLVLKLVRQSSGSIIASTTAEQTVESASDKPADLVVAFDTALGKVLKRTVQWVLTEGVADRKRYIEE